MASKMARPSNGKDHTFGGDWTATKLSVLEKYLKAYTTALKGQPFQKAYIDAFAGTGYRGLRSGRDTSTTELPFPELAEAAPQALLDGSARLALKVQPCFDRYIFVERDADRCGHLNDLKMEFPELAGAIRVQQGEANEEIRKLCRDVDWTTRRAVMFLDPYGMQVEWETIVAIAETKAVDLWLLFPLGVAVTRLVTRSGEIPAGWRASLNALLGTTAWYDEFYRTDPQADLFGTVEDRRVKATTETIGRWFVGRLKERFASVPEPSVLRNSTNCPLYLLCFAAANPRGARVATRIASHLLKDLL